MSKVGASHSLDRATSVPADEPASTTTRDEHLEEGKVDRLDSKIRILLNQCLPDFDPDSLVTDDPINRFIKPIEIVLKDLAERATKTEREIRVLKSTMEQNEEAYEAAIRVKEKGFADAARASRQKAEQLESELRDENKSLRAQILSNEKKYEEKLQYEREIYAKLKKDSGDKLAKIETDLQSATKKIEKAKTAFTKREAQFKMELQSAKDEANALEKKLGEEVANRDILYLDYEATLQEVDDLKGEVAKKAEREAKCADLESEVAALRSARVNPQVIKDSVAKAVREAVAEKQAMIDKLQAELETLKANIAETVQDAVAEKQVVINELQAELEHLKANIAETVREAVADKQATMIDKLQAELEHHKANIAETIREAVAGKQAMIEKLQAEVEHLKVNTAETVREVVAEKQAVIEMLEAALAMLRGAQASDITTMATTLEEDLTL